MKFLQKQQDLSLSRFTLLVSILNAVICSYPIIDKLFNYEFISPLFLLIFSLIFILEISFLNIFYSAILWKRGTKTIVAALFTLNSFVLYFMNTFHIAIDSNILLNVFETHISEAQEFIGYKIFLYILFLGALPSYILWKKTNITYGKNYLKDKLKSVSLSVIAIVLIISPCYLTEKSHLFLKDNQKALTFLPPINYISGLIGYSRKMVSKHLNFRKLQSISDDAVLNGKTKRKNLLVFVIGESVRADHMSLNGYERNTNKFLENYDIISFKNFESCDTMTETTLLCTFSHINRKNFVYPEAFKYETLIHILDKVGFEIYWRSNNGRCKQIACTDGTVSHSIVKSFGNELYDNLLINVLNFLTSTEQTSANKIIFLHQLGSHGPEYYRKYPEEFEIYKPICKNNDISKCDIDALTNVYDNTIYYTSYILGELLERLESLKEQYNVAMVYMSDHGQSLGEEGFFGHATPYNEAPYQQKNPEFFLWFSDNFAEDFNLDTDCLKKKREDKLSQDNIFHSMLGLFNIGSSYYDADLDMFRSCKR